jgi:TolB protein
MLWTMNADGGSQRQLTRPRGSLDAYDTFAWSPDGAYIAATGFSGRESQIYLINVARPDSPVAVTSEPGSAFDPTWSPDGRYIAYVTREGKRFAIRALEVDAGEPPITLLQIDTGRSPRWDPSGGAIAFLSMSGGDFELFMQAVGTDPDGHIVPVGRPAQLTSRFGIDATSGLSWAP